MPTAEELQADCERLRRENEALRAAALTAPRDVAAFLRCGFVTASGDSSDAVGPFAASAVERVDAARALAAHAPRLSAIAAANASRDAALAALGSALAAQASVIDLREASAVHAVRQEAGVLAAAVRRREEELCRTIADDCAAHRAAAAAVAARVEAARASLAAHRAVFSDAAAPAALRLQAIFDSEALVAATAHIEVGEACAFHVSARPLAVDAFLALARTPVPLAGAAPLALTAPQAAAEVAAPCRDADSRGLLWHLSTAGGTRPFANIASAAFAGAGGGVRIVCDTGVAVGDPASLVAFDEDPPFAAPADGPSVFRSRGAKGARVLFDFGAWRRVALDSYCLRHGHEAEHAALRNWALLGAAEDVEGPWVVLDSRRGDTSLTGPFGKAVFRCNGGGSGGAGRSDGSEPQPAASSSSSSLEGSAPSPRKTGEGERPPLYRYLALETTGPNAASLDMFHIELSRVEFFGLMETMPAPATA